MQAISVDQAKVGDVLSEPLLNGEGKVLLPKGARLSAAVVSRMQSWGITSLVVEGSGSGEPDGPAAERLEELERRFAGLEDDALMMYIKETAKKHLSGPA
jgi:hypothetical protein